ncbi:MAG: hypothetical protein WA797_07375 [Acidimicrobiales bacterium]
MADLTRLLSDIYGPQTSTETPQEGVVPDSAGVEDEIESFSDLLTEEMPAWDDEERLDDVFSAWQPGPDEYAAAGEHEMVAEAIAGEDVLGWAAPLSESSPQATALDWNDFEAEESDETIGWAAPEAERLDTPTEEDLPPLDVATAPLDVSPPPVESWGSHIPEMPVADVQPSAEAVRMTSWTRANDDILPSGGVKSGLSFLRR